MQADTLTGGFAAPSHDAAHAFRSLLEAMARPGTDHRLSGVTPPAPLSVAAGAVVLTLCDADTPIHLAGAADCAGVRDWIAFHTGAPIAGPAQCLFALGTWAALAPLDAYRVGTPEYPDRSATLIVERTGSDRVEATLRGPGIRDTACLRLPEIAAFRANHAAYPLGLDFMFTSGDRVTALPRATAVS